MTSGVGTVKTHFLEYGGDFEPIKLKSGEQLSRVTLAYEIYGELNEDRDNAILVFHALTGSQHAAGFNPVSKPARCRPPAQRACSILRHRS